MWVMGLITALEGILHSTRERLMEWCWTRWPHSTHLGHGLAGICLSQLTTLSGQIGLTKYTRCTTQNNNATPAGDR